MTTREKIDCASESVKLLLSDIEASKDSLDPKKLIPDIERQLWTIQHLLDQEEEGEITVATLTRGRRGI